MDLMAQYPDNYFDLAIVDPPYGIERFKKGGSFINKYGSNDRLWNNIKPRQEYFNELFRVSKNQIIWGANNFELPPSEYFLCWNKEQAMQNFATLEYAWVSMGLKKPAKLFTYSIHKHNQSTKVHPTQKPVELYSYILENYAKEGDKILDTHLGSGSIAIACHYRGFELVGCELDEEYYSQMLERFRKETAQLSLLGDL